MTPATKEECLKRLRRLEGQVRGIIKMVEDDRYCIDISVQMQAVAAALGKVQAHVLTNHIRHCVVEAVESGDADIREEKLSELLEIVEKLSKG